MYVYTVTLPSLHLRTSEDFVCHLARETTTTTTTTTTTYQANESSSLSFLLLLVVRNAGDTYKKIQLKKELPVPTRTNTVQSIELWSRMLRNLSIYPFGAKNSNNPPANSKIHTTITSTPNFMDNMTMLQYRRPCRRHGGWARKYCYVLVALFLTGSCQDISLRNTETSCSECSFITVHL